MLERLRSIGGRSVVLSMTLTLVACGGSLTETFKEQCHAKTKAGVIDDTSKRITACVILGDTYMGLSVLDPGAHDRKAARRAYKAGCEAPIPEDAANPAVIAIMSASSCQKLVEFHLADDDPALVARATEKATARGMPPRSDEVVAKEVADRKESNRKIIAKVEADNPSKSSFLDIVSASAGAVSTVAGSQANAAGVDPKTAAALKQTADVAKTTSDVARVIDAATDGNQSISAGTASTRAAACASASAAVSATGPCSGSPTKREIGECTCVTTGTGATKLYACHVETKFACAAPAGQAAVASSSTSAGAGSTSGVPAPRVVAVVASPAAPPMIAGESTSTLNPSAANLPGALSDPACDANDTCKSLQKMCNDKNASGCTGLASGYQLGLFGVAKDPAKAAALNAVMCDADPTGPGCVSLAAMYSQGAGVPKSKERALALSKRSCDANLAAACSMVSSFGDAKYASVKLRSLCDGDDPMACIYLSGVASEKPHALERLHVLCDRGNAAACSALTNIH